MAAAGSGVEVSFTIGISLLPSWTVWAGMMSPVWSGKRDGCCQWKMFWGVRDNVVILDNSHGKGES